MSGELPPVVCTLGAEELRDRGAAWRRVLDSGLVERSPIKGGIRLVAAPGARAALTELIDLERQCCAWISYEVPDATTFLLTAEGEGAAVLAGMFLPDGAGRVAF